MKKLLLIWFFVGFSLGIFAQKESFACSAEYDSELYGSIMFHTNGWGISGTKLKHRTEAKKWLFTAELVTIKHLKEEKRLNPYVDNTKKYVYGKLNYFAVLRPSIGQQKIIYAKGSKLGVQVAINYNIGASIGFTRPVYLEILYPSVLGRPEGSTPSSEAYNPELHKPEMILGRDTYFRGFNQTTVYPGIHGKVGFNFDYASVSNLVRGIETGLAFDVYLKKIPLMAFVHNQRFFVTGYMSFHFGKKQ